MDRHLGLGAAAGLAVSLGQAGWTGWGLASPAVHVHAIPRSIAV